MKKPESGSVLDVPVDFGGVSIGDATARLGVKIARQVLNINAADDLLCGKRLSGKVVICPKDESADQQRLFEGDKQILEAVFDVKRFSASPKDVSAGLTFNLNAIDVSELSHYAKQSGRLVVMGVEEIPQDGEDSDDDEIDANFEVIDDDETDEASDETDEDDGETEAANDEMRGSEEETRDDGEADTDPAGWRRKPISDLNLDTADNNKLMKGCAKKGIRTLGQLSKVMNDHGQWWNRELPGVGMVCAEHVSDAFARYFQRHPEYCQ